MFDYFSSENLDELDFHEPKDCVELLKLRVDEHYKSAKKSKDSHDIMMGVLGLPALPFIFAVGAASNKSNSLAKRVAGGVLAGLSAPICVPYMLGIFLPLESIHYNVVKPTKNTVKKWRKKLSNEAATHQM